MNAEHLGRVRYISLTTYRRNGVGVATPVWVVRSGDELWVWTRSDSWKVKRLRRDKAVRVAPCDVRGRVAEDAPAVDGTARFLYADEMPRLRKLLGRKYRLQYWLLDLPATLVRLGKRPHTGIAVTLGGSAKSADVP
ncbi:PPOX class F420-dependent oxidoreductase [Streptomyces sp. LHD-70]|uniref:PPOX class F420-dependent oxidoreductase n=1 Tax=Streptomyces sp. LHD-70 TaxID=3072140 RepID=UPI0028104762|nr:PPOX class F420-dependent oxidoreductase [Streptomyces sp. LHD-70]MDQ8705585.1 PPOX class F420-dependent oxidoreductase [Streptomyces sp. LHD-70]